MASKRVVDTVLVRVTGTSDVHIRTTPETPVELSELSKRKDLKKNTAQLIQVFCSAGYEVVAMTTIYRSMYVETYCLQRFSP